MKKKHLRTINGNLSRRQVLKYAVMSGLGGLMGQGMSKVTAYLRQTLNTIEEKAAEKYRYNILFLLVWQMRTEFSVIDVKMIKDKSAKNLSYK